MVSSAGVATIATVATVATAATVATIATIATELCHYSQLLSRVCNARETELQVICTVRRILS
jgi:hypothetical protein